MTDLRPEDERLASRLDQALPPGVSRAPRQTSDPLVNTALLLARLQVPPLSAEADARIQQRVLAAMRTPKARSPWRPATYVRWLAAACLIVVALTVGILPIAASSLPGEPLYSVKRGFEQIELLLATTSESQARVNLTQAERRLEEQVQLVERGQFDPSLVTSAALSMQASSEAARASGDPNLVTSLQERSTSLTLRFAGLLEAAGEDPLPSPNAGSGVPPVEGAEGAGALPSNTPAPSRTPTLAGTPVAPGRPALLPLPPGLATRFAPAAGIISTQAADATATCEHGRSCQSSGLAGSTPAAGGSSQTDNSNSNGNANGNSNGTANENVNANANANANADSNANSNGNANGTTNGNAGGNSEQTGGANGNGNANGASNGNNGNANGNNQGNSSGNSPPPDAGGGSQGNGNSDGSNNGNSNGNSSNNGNSNGNSSNNGNGNGNSNGNSNNNGNGNGNSDS